MKLFSCLAIVALFCSCSAEPVYKDPNASIDKRVEDLLHRMTLEEKILQVNQFVVGENSNDNNVIGAGREFNYEIGSLIYLCDNPVLANEIQRKAVEQTRLGIPILFGQDVIHGFRTLFPIPLAQACSWNIGLVEESCQIAASEAYSAGVRWTFSPMVDIARDPRWGRVMEGYGEDPYAASCYCRAAVHGYQGDSVANDGRIAACLKHFVGYGASEAGLDYVHTEISDQTLWDTYLQPFNAGVQQGALTVMSAFNTLSGIPASGNRHTLTDILRGKLGFEGFVVSDWDAVKQLIIQGMCEDDADATKTAIEAGVDMDMVDYLYLNNLESLIVSGNLDMDVLDEAVRRILRVKFTMGLFEHPYTDEKNPEEVFLLPRNKEVAKQLAEESIVLLKNRDAILPLSADARISFAGELGKSNGNLCGNWPCCGLPSDNSPLLETLKQSFHHLSESSADSDIVICCIGQESDKTGENHSFSNIDLPSDQVSMVRELKSRGKKIVALLMNGRPLALGEVEPFCDAILDVWHLGTMASEAIVATLSGESNPSGKLAMTFPYSSGQIPVYYNRRPRSRQGTQGFYEDVTTDPLYCFGYGLSYSSFDYSDIELSSSECDVDGTITAKVTVSNTSEVDGKEAVLWFIQDPVSKITRPVRELRHFEKRLIPAGETRSFEFEIVPSRDLSFVDADGNPYLETGVFNVMAGEKTATFRVR